MHVRVARVPAPSRQINQTPQHDLLLSNRACDDLDASGSPPVLRTTFDRVGVGSGEQIQSDLASAVEVVLESGQPRCEYGLALTIRQVDAGGDRNEPAVGPRLGDPQVERASLLGGTSGPRLCDDGKQGQCRQGARHRHDKVSRSAATDRLINEEVLDDSLRSPNRYSGEQLGLAQSRARVVSGRVMTPSTSGRENGAGITKTLLISEARNGLSLCPPRLPGPARCFLGPRLPESYWGRRKRFESHRSHGPEQGRGPSS